MTASTQDAIFLAGERGFLRRDIAREPDDDLTFDAESAITGAAHLSMALHCRRGEDFAGAGIGNAKIGLHHRRRAADLVTHRQTEPGLAQSPVDLRLNDVGLDFVGRPQIFGKVYEADDNRWLTNEPAADSIWSGLSMRVSPVAHGLPRVGG